jgi:uncharacterized membrane protein YebE (DUF533 family)
MLKEQAQAQFVALKAKLSSEDNMIALGAGAVVAAGVTALTTMASAKTVATVATVGGLLAVGTLAFAGVTGLAKGMVLGYRTIKSQPPVARKVAAG